MRLYSVVKIKNEELVFLMLSCLKIHIILFLDRLRRGAYCVARVTCPVDISIETNKDTVTTRKGKTLHHR